MGEAQSREKTDEERSVYMHMLIIYTIHTSACMRQVLFFHSNVDIKFTSTLAHIVIACFVIANLFGTSSLYVHVVHSARSCQSLT